MPGDFYWNHFCVFGSPHVVCLRLKQCTAVGREPFPTAGFEATPLFPFGETSTRVDVWHWYQCAFVLPVLFGTRQPSELWPPWSPAEIIVKLLGHVCLRLSEDPDPRGKATWSSQRPKTGDGRLKRQRVLTTKSASHGPADFSFSAFK